MDIKQSESNKEAILEIYPRKGNLFSEALKVNLKIIPALTEIARGSTFYQNTKLCWIDLSISSSNIDVVRCREKYRKVHKISL